MMLALFAFECNKGSVADFAEIACLARKSDNAAGILGKDRAVTATCKNPFKQRPSVDDKIQANHLL